MVQKSYAHHARFLRVRPVPAAVTSCLAAGGFLLDRAALAVAAIVLFVAGGFLVPDLADLVIIVVPALVLLASLLLLSLSETTPVCLVWRLGARVEGLPAGAGWLFSGDSGEGLIGDWGSVREL